MTKVILHGIECVNGERAVEVKPSSALINTNNIRDWYWVETTFAGHSVALGVTKKALLQFAEAILEEFDDEEPDVEPVSYVEVIS